ELELKFDAANGSFSVWYHDHRFPIDPRDYPRIVSDLGRLPQAHRELFGRFQALNALESEVHSAGQALKLELARRAGADPALVRALEAAAAAFRGTPGELDSWMPLHALLENQSYRASYWRAAADEINYRRFFNINDLAGIRVEQEDLFEETHRLVLDWVAQGK